MGCWVDREEGEGGRGKGRWNGVNMEEMMCDGSQGKGKARR